MKDTLVDYVRDAIADGKLDSSIDFLISERDSMRDIEPRYGEEADQSRELIRVWREERARRVAEGPSFEVGQRVKVIEVVPMGYRGIAEPELGTTGVVVGDGHEDGLLMVQIHMHDLGYDADPADEDDVRALPLFNYALEAL
jgi:hypothetical protein